MRVFGPCVECETIQVVVCLLYFDVSWNDTAIYVAQMAVALYMSWKESCDLGAV